MRRAGSHSQEPRRSKSTVIIYRDVCGKTNCCIVHCCQHEVQKHEPCWAELRRREPGLRQALLAARTAWAQPAAVSVSKFCHFAVENVVLHFRFNSLWQQARCWLLPAGTFVDIRYVYPLFACAKYLYIHICMHPVGYMSASVYMGLLVVL